MTKLLFSRSNSMYSSCSEDQDGGGEPDEKKTKDKSNFILRDSLVFRKKTGSRALTTFPHLHHYLGKDGDKKEWESGNFRLGISSYTSMLTGGASQETIDSSSKAFALNEYFTPVEQEVMYRTVLLRKDFAMHHQAKYQDTVISKVKIPSDRNDIQKEQEVRVKTCKGHQLSKADEISLRLLGGQIDIVVLWLGYDNDPMDLLRALRSIDVFVPWFHTVRIVKNEDRMLPEYIDLEAKCLSVTTMPKNLTNVEGVQWRIATRGVVEDLSEHFIMLDAGRHWFGRGPVPLSTWFSPKGASGEYNVHISTVFTMHNIDQMQEGEVLQDGELTDISSCAPGCSNAMLGDSICDRACMNPDCNGDMGDCATIYAGKADKGNAYDPKRSNPQMMKGPLPHTIDIHPSRDGDQFFLHIEECRWKGRAGGIWIDLSMLFPVLPVSRMGASSWSPFSDYKLLQRERGALFLFARRDGSMKNESICSPSLNGTVDLVFENTLFSVRRHIRLHINQWHLQTEKLSSIVPFTSVLPTVAASNPQWVINELLGSVLLKQYISPKLLKSVFLIPIHCSSEMSHRVVRTAYEDISKALIGTKNVDNVFHNLYESLMGIRNSAHDCTKRLNEKGRIYVNWKQGMSVTAHQGSKTRASFSSSMNRWAIPFNMVGKRQPTTEMLMASSKSPNVQVPPLNLQNSMRPSRRIVDKQTLLSYIYTNRVIVVEQSRFQGTFKSMETRATKTRVIDFISKSSQRKNNMFATDNPYKPIKLENKEWGKRPVISNIPLLYSQKIAKTLSKEAFQSEVKNTENSKTNSHQDFVFSMAYHHSILNNQPELSQKSIQVIFELCDTDNDGLLSPAKDIECLITLSPLVYARRKVLTLMNQLHKCIATSPSNTTEPGITLDLIQKNMCPDAFSTISSLYSRSLGNIGSPLTHPFKAKLLLNDAKDRHEWVVNRASIGIYAPNIQSAHRSYYLNGLWEVGDKSSPHYVEGGKEIFNKGIIEKQQCMFEKQKK
eukprot:Nk52_evm40s2496 gene=Nk52_evmTU40s2496